MVRTFREPQPSNTPRWILTYTDLCTLLLTFFVLLVSMSTIDGKRERKALDSLVGSFGPMPGGRSITGSPKGAETLDKRGSGLAGRTIDLQMLRELSTKNHLDADQVQMHKNKTTLRISQKVLFDPGSTELNPQILNYLTEVAEYLKRKDDEIEIRGHTDLLEGINQPGWSNHSWDVSAKRAQALYDFFQKEGIHADRMSSHGYSYYKPVANSREYPHLSEENQRVEIVLGPNDQIPTHMTRQEKNLTHGFNYKNFFFRLYPQNEPSSEMTDETRPDLYDWLQAK